MALNFGILSQVPSFGQQFMAGQQAAQAQQERNMLRQAQAEQMQFQRENMLAQRGERMAMAADREEQTRARRAAALRQAEADEYLGKVSALFEQNNTPLNLATARQGLAFAIKSRDPNAIQMMTKTVQALEEKESYTAEAARLGLPGAAAPVTPANALAAPPAAAAPAGITREMAQRMILSPDPRIREQGKALLPSLEKPEKPQTYTPSADMQGYELAKSEGFKGTFFDYKRQLAEAGRPPPQPREAKDDPRAVVAFRETDAAGNVTLLNKFGQVITPTAPVKGKPSATFEKTTAQRKQLGLDLDRAITELTDATKKGGLIDQSTGSGAGRLVDIGAGFVGQATPGAIAGGKLAPIADLVLKMVPRFEGPQSDKDTTSYKEAAGQLANTALPNAIRKQAGLEILRLMKERKGQFVSAEMAAEGTEAASAAPAGGGNFPAPPAAAIDALRRGQGTDAQFDAIFGPGAAARARGR
jgi:hypothetical protein